MAILRRTTLAAFWIGYAWCAYLIAANSLPYFGDAGRWQPFLIEKGPVAQYPWYFIALRLHVFGGILCLTTILLQFSPYLLRRIPSLHRWNGRIYGLSVLLLVCLPGIPLSLFAKGGAAGQAGFLILGFLTFGTTWLGIQTARHRKFAAHRRWMIRSFALVASAITFRLLQIALYLALPALDDATIYIVCLYASTFGNLAAAEYFISKTRNPKPVPTHENQTIPSPRRRHPRPPSPLEVR